MNQPSIFISCVSPEFRQTRSRVAAILTRLGYTPVMQEIFGTEPGDLRQILRDKIDACQGLIQIGGRGYGAEPPTVDADWGRVSYTQFEFIYARSRKKKTWLLFAGDACTRDTPLERLDLPNDPAHPDPPGCQAERHALQLAYCDKRRNDGHIYYDVTSDADLDLKVERLRDELAELRRAEEAFRRELLAGQKEILGRLTVTTEKIRAHLRESAERTHQVALAEAANARGWEERERLRKAAEQAHAGRLSRIDELADSFAEIEGTGRSTQVFDEMTRILAEESVDQALAYVATQRPGILEKVKARAIATREKNRADLLPLLKSAQLQADRNQPAEATRLFAEILAVAPDWPDALDAQFWFLIIQGDHAFDHTTLAEAFGYFQAAETTVQRLLKAEPDAPRSQHNLSVASENLGDFLASRGQQGDAEKALAHYQRCNELRERLLRDNPQSAQAARDVSVSLEKLGDFLASRGQRGDAEKALAHCQRCNELRERLLRDNPQSAQAARDVSVSLEKLGDFLASRGQANPA